MFNLKNYKLFIGFVLTLFTISCSQTTNSKKNTLNSQLIKPLYIEHILAMPSDFGTIWNPLHLTENNTSKIYIVSKGGSGPNNMIEKFSFNFNQLGLCDTFYYNNYTHSTTKLDEFYFDYTNKTLSKIQLIKHLNYSNIPPVYAFSSSEKFTVCKQKTAQTKDSLFFIPNFNQPQLITEKIGGKYNSIEIIVAKGTSAKRILDQVSLIDTNSTSVQYAEKLITYTKNGMPIESFYLDQNWNQLELAKKWEYDENNNPTQFSQWVHGKIVKEIEIYYNENQLPFKMIFNRKKYYFIYKKHNA